MWKPMAIGLAAVTLAACQTAGTTQTAADSPYNFRTDALMEEMQTAENLEEVIARGGELLWVPDYVDQGGVSLLFPRAVLHYSPEGEKQVFTQDANQRFDLGWMLVGEQFCEENITTDDACVEKDISLALEGYPVILDNTAFFFKPDGTVDYPAYFSTGNITGL